MCQASKQAVINAVHHFIDKANSLYSKELEYPRIRFDKRGATGGTANSIKWELNFNAGLMDDNLAEYINQVAPHEVAHLVVYALVGTERSRSGRRISHGRNFKRVMRAFGCDTSTTHNMDTSKVKQARRQSKQFEYACNGCGEHINMGAIRHKKQQAGLADYLHACKQSHAGIVFIKQV